VVFSGPVSLTKARGDRHGCCRQWRGTKDVVIALAIHAVLHIGIDRSKGERHITEVLRVKRYKATEDTFITTLLYTFARDRITA
jgi:hypothetical protein